MRPIPTPSSSKRPSRRHLIAASAAMLAALGIAVAGCGGTADHGNSTSARSAFAWLRPAPAPPTWRTSRLPDGAAALAYPLRWRPIRTDPGTISAALRSEQGQIRGYLNATPRQGAETPSNWSSFRPDHNRDEGDADVSLVASGTNLRFRDGRGSCVVDDYRS